MDPETSEETVRKTEGFSFGRKYPGQINRFRITTAKPNTTYSGTWSIVTLPGYEGEEYDALTNGSDYIPVYHVLEEFAEAVRTHGPQRASLTYLGWEEISGGRKVTVWVVRRD